MRKKKRPFPDARTLKEMRDKLSDPNYEGGNLALSPHASEVEKAKCELCQLIARYKREHNLLQKEVAERIGVDEARISAILRCRTDGFTLDRLIGYAQKLYSEVHVRITAA